MATRWRLANGPPLPVDDLWPLLNPRHRLDQFAPWLEQQCKPAQEDEARAAVRLHVEALEPAEVAVLRVGIPVDRVRKVREELLTLLDAVAPVSEISRVVGAFAKAWESLRPRLIALKLAQEETVSKQDDGDAPTGVTPVGEGDPTNSDQCGSAAVPTQNLIALENESSRLVTRVLRASHWPSESALGEALRFLFSSPTNEEEDALAEVYRADGNIQTARDLLTRLLARTIDHRMGAQRAACIVGLLNLGVDWHSSAARKLRAMTPAQLKGLPADLVSLHVTCLRDVIAPRDAGSAPDPTLEAEFRDRLATAMAVVRREAATEKTPAPGGSTTPSLATQSGPGAFLQFESRIGEGAFGEVWRGCDLIRPLAIKLFRGGELATEFAVAHAKALAKVDHPNIIKVHFIDSAVHPTTRERMPCVACELVEGETLGELLHRRARTQEPTELAEARRVGLAIIDGVAHIHARDTIHGDLHSGNVMVAQGAVKVIDLFSTGSLRVLSSAPGEMRVRADVSDLTGLCYELLLAVEGSEGAAMGFGMTAFRQRRTLEDVRTAFELATRGPGPQAVL
jgi:hypothetical protein